jgi:hypothetical protein
VPDQTDDLPLDIADPEDLRPATFEPTPAPFAAAVEAPAETIAEPQPAEPDSAPSFTPAEAAVAPVVLEAVAPPEPEIPPPPMPFEFGPPPARPEPPEPAPAVGDVWPAYAPGEVGSNDPFARGPLDPAAIEAPALDAFALDRTKAIPRGFGAKSAARAEIPPRREQNPKAASAKMSWPKLSGLNFATPGLATPGLATPGLATPGLWAVLVIGAAVFAWSIWSIFTTTPGPVNFIAGLFGIAVMAVPAYLLLGARGR